MIKAFYNLVEQYHYYFMKYIYVWIPLMIFIFIFTWWWEKTHEKFEEEKQHKHIITVMKKDGLNWRRTILTNLKDFYLYDIMTHPEKTIRREFPPEQYKTRHITPSCTFEIDKEKFEPLYNNFFANRIPLRWILKHRKWNWYKKFTCFFKEEDSEGITLTSGKKYEINIGNKSQVITAKDIKILVDTNIIRNALNDMFTTSIGDLFKRFGFIAIIGIVGGIIVYMYMTGGIKF